MTILIIIICLILIGIITVQIGRVAELSKSIRGEEKSQYKVNNSSGILLMVFMVVFLLGSVISALYFKDSMLGYGPWTSASEHGVELDSLFNTTLFFTGIVFVITQILLFYYGWKYRARPGRKAKYVSHNDTLEMVWTAIPAVVMAFLVIRGLDAWNESMGDIKDGEEYMEIEATGYQFGWLLRYPGEDEKLGTRDYRLINDGNNPLGQDWTDTKNLDDFQPSKIVLPKGKQVRVRITSRDVLHNFNLTHFRLKMDAIPGIPTYFVFTPRFTTAEYRDRLGALNADGEPLYPQWHEIDPVDPDGRKRWETFNFELACAELCGRGHYSMRKEVEIVSPEEYEVWKAEQTAYFLQTVRGTDADPYDGEYFPAEIEEHRKEFLEEVDTAMTKATEDERTVALKYIHYKTGAANLEQRSRFQLDDLASIMKENPEVRIVVEGHTDDTGTYEVNTRLSTERAAAVASYLINKADISADRVEYTGFGSAEPIADNDTEEGRAQNRRVAFRIK